jgi:hypothetical protein
LWAQTQLYQNLRHYTASDVMTSMQHKIVVNWVDETRRPVVEDIWLTREQLSERWHMPKSTLNQWASQRKGPPYALFGRHARYRLSDVIAWEAEQFAQQE